MRTTSIIALMMETADYAPLKRRATSTRLHGIISKKVVTFILAAVRTCTPTYHHKIPLCTKGKKKH
jgi:hypothetical protein